MSAQSQLPVQKGVGIRLVDAPSARREDPRAQLYVIDHVRPGAGFTRRIEVSNGTGAPVTLQLYPAAAEVRAGQFTVVEGRSTNELTSWVTVDPPTVTLAVGARAQATVRVAVPTSASEGERYGVVLAELPAKAAAPGSIAVASRVGVRMYLSVGPGGEPRSDFLIESLTAAREADGRPVVRATVRNTGGRALDLSGDLRLTNGPGSLSAGPFAAKLGTTLALGEIEPVTVPLDRSLPAGPWDARIELRSGTTTRVATGRITFPAPGTVASPVPATPVTSGKSGLPLLAGIGAGILGLLGLLFLVLRRRGRGNEDDRKPAAAAVVVPLQPAPSVERDALRRHAEAPGPEALEELLVALRQASADGRDEVAEAAASYGRTALRRSKAYTDLPPHLATAVWERTPARIRRTTP